MEMIKLDEAIKCEYEFADFCEFTASTYDMDDYYERNMAYKAGECAKEHRQIAELLKELKRLREQEPVIDKIRTEVEALLPPFSWNPIKNIILETLIDVLRIIDKYKKEQEE